MAHFGRRDAASPPRGQRYSPHAPQQEHAPSSTLLLRGLAPSVDDEMILRTLQPFRPQQARTMYDKTTGEPRGFAFVDFDRVEGAVEAVRAFELRPLVLQHQRVTVSYTDGYRRRSPDGDAGRPRGGSVGSRHGDSHHDSQRPGERWQPRPDWICDDCNVTNFARRTNCFQCNAPRTAQTKEVPVTAALRTEQIRSHSDSHYGDPPAHDEPFKNAQRRDENARSVPPSQVLMVRLLPPDIEEGELQVVFAEFDGVQDIRLIRDRVTNLSRGFGFVEFRDIEAATQALKKCGDLVVQNTHVEVSYARDTLSTRSHYPPDSFQVPPRTGSSMAVTALEQAQWSLSQGRGADAANTDQNLVAADVSALLDSAAAEVTPHFEEPKKMWPLPFETAGGSYVYASEYGLYWDPDSMFYYDAQTKVYHNSFTGVYYQCVRPSESGAAAFQVFVPPVPVDTAPFQELAEKMPTANKPALSLSLKKEKKKTPGISFGIKTTAFAPTTPAFEKKNQVKTIGSVVTVPAASAVSATSVGMKRKSADDIAKWSQRQREAKAQEHESSNASAPIPSRQVGDTTHFVSTTSTNEDHSSQQKAATSADSVIDALTSVPQEVPICLLCRRKFGSLEMLHKHEKLSKLHLTNLAKAKENKQHIAAQYREHEKEMERDAKKQRQEERAPSNPAPGNNQWHAPTPAPVISAPEPPASSLESGIGGKMLKMMGWKSGEGLGKHGTGITAPIKAAGQGGRSDTAGLGSKAPLSASMDLSDVTSDKERRQRLARARYDADNA
ncbi:RNA-binding protein 10 [Phytophthora cinnamomi]|uniref:RNA-binding protein 10 n=1 Tax=Phytophthora cinnamomi TaxID=4785 RepID=UPI0035595AD1|nr:RNA-binding protein 10 [Phytophthora cinnamomi]